MNNRCRNSICSSVIFSAEAMVDQSKIAEIASIYALCCLGNCNAVVYPLDYFLDGQFDIMVVVNDPVPQFIGH